jgi:hypothetical protein
MKLLEGEIKDLQKHINRKMYIPTGIHEFKTDYCSTDISKE